MEEGPPESAVGSRLQTTFRRLSLRVVVGSVEGKSECNSGEVRCQEMSNPEPVLTRRKLMKQHQNRSRFVIPGQVHWRIPNVECAVFGVKQA